MADIRDRAQALFRRFKPDYGEVRHESSLSDSISLRDKESNVSSASSEGIGVRLLVKGSWGFASSDDTEKLEEMFGKANSLARLTKGASRVSPFPSSSGKFRAKARIRFGDVDIGQKFKEMRELKKELLGKSITSTAVRYSDSTCTDVVVNSEGSVAEQVSSRIYLSFTSVAKQGNIMQRASERIGETSGYEAVEKCFILARDCPERARALLSASPAPAGKFPVVVDGRMTGLLCHEALGHACEADSVIAGSSILKGKMGSGIGSSLVTVTDNPLMEGAFGHYIFDDEGTRAKGTTLVSKGKLTGFLHSRETATRLGMKPSGNARAQGYSSNPIVRMSNTCLARGESEVGELFEGVKLGVYAKGMNGGVVDTTTGYFVFGAEDGFLIENGRRTKLLRDVLLSGNILETLRNVDCVANDFLGSPGFCGKMGQSVPVSDGGPHIRISSVTVGGSGATK